MEPLLEISAKYIKKAIRIDTNAIDKFERRKFSKKEGMNIFILPPSKTIGIVPIKIDLNNLSCKRYSRNFLEDWLLKLKISFLHALFYKLQLQTISWFQRNQKRLRQKEKQYFFILAFNF